MITSCRLRNGLKPADNKPMQTPQISRPLHRLPVHRRASTDDVKAGVFVPMKTKALEARPTEYAGTLFRSKTEAVYARAFDIIGWQWEYEPEIPLWPHNPDFLLAAPVRESALSLLVVEIKPSKPTSAYLMSIKDPAAKWAEGFRRAAMVMYGNPWDGACVHRVMMKDGEWGMPISTSFAEKLIEAKAYRFDLEPEGNQ